MTLVANSGYEWKYKRSDRTVKRFVFENLTKRTIHKHIRHFIDTVLRIQRTIKHTLRGRKIKRNYIFEQVTKEAEFLFEFYLKRQNKQTIEMVRNLSKLIVGPR